MKKLIDIEKLLQWAMRDELPKGRPVSSDIGASIATRLRRRAFGIAASFSATRIRERDTLGIVPGSPHEDAERVADAVAALPDREKFSVRPDARLMFGEWIGIAEHCIPALMSSIFNPQALIVAHSLVGTRPRWEFDQPSARAVLVDHVGVNGKNYPRALVEGVDDDGAIVALSQTNTERKKGVYNIDRAPRSPLHWTSPDLLAIGEARAEYVYWQAALVRLVADLAGKLQEFEPAAPIVRRYPWITGQGGFSRVLSDGKEDAGDALPLQPRRAAGERPLDVKIIVESRPRPRVLREARAILAARKREMAGNAA